MPEASPEKVEQAVAKNATDEIQNPVPEGAKLPEEYWNTVDYKSGQYSDVDIADAASQFTWDHRPAPSAAAVARLAELEGLRT